MNFLYNLALPIFLKASMKNQCTFALLLIPFL